MPSAAAMTRAARRARQTATTFEHWPRALVALGGGSFGRGRAEIVLTTRSGQRMTVPNRPGARVPIFEVFAEDCYRLSWFLGERAGTALRVLDVGAHVGAFAVQCATLFPQSSVVCFEASPATAAYLTRNLRDNGLTLRTEVHAVAVAAATGTVSFADNGVSSALNHVATAADATGVTVVPCRAFDDVVERHGPFDVVKLDCEGAEYDIVLGSSVASWSRVTEIVLEYHPSDSYGWTDLAGWLDRVGFDLVARAEADSRQGTAWARRRAHIVGK